MSAAATGAGPRMRPDLLGLATYSSARPGLVPVRVRASSNEAPGEAPAELVAAASAALHDAGRYPVLHGADLVEALAAAYAVGTDQVAVGDGALPLLDRVLLAHLAPGNAVVTAWRSYEAYPMSIQVAGGRSVPVALAADGTHDLDAMAAAVEQSDAVAVIVCNPNNPTGTVNPWPAVEELLDRLPAHVLVVLDEAYVEYSDLAVAGRCPMAELLERPNLLVLRTFSKAHAMAGLRVGYALAPTPITAAVRAVSPPFPVSTPATAAALTSLRHPEWVGERVGAVRAERARISALLSRHGLPVLPSQANFVWTPVGEAATDLAGLAAEHGLLVRPFAGEGVRITVGHPDLAEVLADVLDAWEDRRAP